MISENDILETLRSHAGIDAAQTGEASLRAEIRRALSTCSDPQRLLDIGSSEWEALLEASLVPETWFFRNIEAFEALAHWATQTWLPAHPDTPLRLLSLPCASGEEPYTIAMCLLDAGIPPERFDIRAGDISEQSLTRARHAIYRRNSFRSGFDDIRYAKFFDDLGDGSRRVTQSIRDLVAFDRMNLVNPTSPLPPSDVIFCRNALIYFDQNTQRAVISTLHGTLSDLGILFLGPVEPPVAIQCGFVTAKIPMAFACFKNLNQPAAPDAPPKPRSTIRSKLTSSPPLSKNSTSPTRAQPPARPAPLTPPASITGSLETARSLADAGHIQAAADMLDALTTSETPSSELFCMRGLVSEALGRQELAETFYRKALYLDPAHYESLAHLAELLELQNRSAAAAPLRRRANQIASP